MKKTLIATAILVAAGFAQADVVVGESTNTDVLEVGVSNVDAGTVHQSGYPGVGFGSTIINLSGIQSYVGNGSTTSGDYTFSRYLLNGYTHQDGSTGGTITTAINWYQVPSISNEVYFGVATDDTGASAAFVVGDQDGFAVPSAATSYAAVGLLNVGNSSSNVDLTGTLTLAANYGSLTGDLSGGIYNLNIDATTVSSSAGTFSGTSTLSGTDVASGTSGTTSGYFFGSGSTSAVAGVAEGTSGTAYVAAFGGVAK